MSIIKLEEPWCFNAMSLEQREVISLQKHFVNEDNHQDDWQNTDYCGITSDGLSDYFFYISYFDTEDENSDNVTVYTIEQLRDIIAEHLAKQPVEKLEDGVVYHSEHTMFSYLFVNEKEWINLSSKMFYEGGISWDDMHQSSTHVITKATPEQIAHYEACVKAGKYVEPESITQFVVGKWYKWFQKDHGREQKGKCVAVHDNHFAMKPWICNSSECLESGMFTLKDAESIELIEDLSEIQDLLPEGHEDRAPKPTRSERYLATMKFFEQLKEPERSEAIANYDEDYDRGTKVPKDLAEAINYGFEWYSTKQEHEYWMVIKDKILAKTYFKKELLVFGKYKIGDIVVLQVCTDRYPMFKVSKDSTPDKMIDETGAHSTNPGSFRPATPEEVEAYNQGVRNITDIKTKDYKEAVHCTTQEEWDFVLDTIAYTKVLKSNFENYTEDSYIDTNEQTYGNVYGFGTEYDTILTFNQWCEKYGRSYEVKPWVAEVGDWVYVLEDDAYGSDLMKGEIVKCIQNDPDSQQFKYDGSTWLHPKHYRKATQEEIDSVIIQPVFPDQKMYLIDESEGLVNGWTADNWYVEVSSQEEADAVIDAAAKMYGKGIDKQFTIISYQRVGIDDTGDYCLIADWQIGSKKPRPITDFIQPEKKSSIFEQLRESMFDSDMAWYKLHSTIEKHKQQDELVIYKPKRVIL